MGKSNSRHLLELKHVAALFHTILFSYQKKYREILHRGNAVFLQPVLNFLGNIAGEDGHHLDDLFGFLGLGDKSSDVEQALNEFANTIQTSGFAYKVSVSRGESYFDLYVEGCSLNSNCYVHKKLKPVDVICPWGLLGMLIFEKKTGLAVHPEDTAYTDNSALTRIKAKEI